MWVMLVGGWLGFGWLVGVDDVVGWVDDVGVGWWMLVGLCKRYTSENGRE